ncbi:hypothetical protein QYF61_024182 [Mycteria americana]|uniref:Uncharacterized protein n=1 Tax=Mycteria americana TaxID=33587 RepID=A0AAN7MZT2_MYCAM|nr:hypothetical protein QYF61_024182 [Mycteria americana]
MHPKALNGKVLSISRMTWQVSPLKLGWRTAVLSTCWAQLIARDKGFMSIFRQTSMMLQEGNLIWCPRSQTGDCEGAQGLYQKRGARRQSGKLALSLPMQIRNGRHTEPAQKPELNISFAPLPDSNYCLASAKGLPGHPQTMPGSWQLSSLHPSNPSPISNTQCGLWLSFQGNHKFVCHSLRFVIEKTILERTLSVIFVSAPDNSIPSLMGWRLNHFPGQPVPMLDNPFSEVKFPNIQSKTPLAQLEAISSCPIACYLGEETDPHLSTTSFQAVVESDKVSPQPPFLQAKQPQFPQPLLIRLLLQTLHQLRCPSLDTLQHLNVSLVVRGPKLNTVFEGHNHFPSPAGHTISDTSQDAIGFLGHLGTLLAHIQPAVNQHPQVLLCWAAFQPLFPKPVALHGVAVAQVQDPALSLVEPHTIGPSPSIQPVQSLPTLQQINTPARLGVICKLTEGALDPFIQIIDKDVKQNWPQHRALGNTACDRPPTGVNSIHHHSLGLAVQPVLYPAKSTPIQAMSSQFLQKNAVGNRVKGFTEV